MNFSVDSGFIIDYFILLILLRDKLQRTQNEKTQERKRKRNKIKMVRKG